MSEVIEDALRDLFMDHMLRQYGSRFTGDDLDREIALFKNSAVQITAERERCAGVVRNVIRESNRMMSTDVQWYRAALRSVLYGMDPEEGKTSLSRPQEIEDAIAEAKMEQREADAKIAEGMVFGCDGTPEGIEIARMIRGVDRG